MKRELLIASGNRDKIKEIKEILKDLDIKILTKDNFADFPQVVEDKDTILGNATKKAVEVSQKYNIPTLADDTGLFVEALNGAPGVYSARYAGVDCSYQDNREKLLRDMKDKENRKAYFETVAVLAKGNKVIAAASGKVTGSIAYSERGTDGFGYDAIFVEDKSGKTYAEMGEIEKNKISHRGLALSKMRKELIKYFHIDTNSMK